MDVPNSVPTAAFVPATVIGGATGATLASRDLRCHSVSCHSPGRSRVPPSPIAATDFSLPSEGHARVAGEEGDGAVVHRLGLWKEDILNNPEDNEKFCI